MTSAVIPSIKEALRPEELRTGHWFHRLLVARLEAYNAKHPPEQMGLAREPAPAAKRIIRKTAAEAVMLGTGTAAITTTAGVLTAETLGLAGVLALPAAAVAMLGDLASRAWMTLEMTCDIGALFGVRFDPNDVSDLSQLYAVTLEGVKHAGREDARGRELLEWLVPARAQGLCASVGSVLGSETLVRNMVPVLGLATSGAMSYHATRRIGNASLHYARARRALTDAFAEVEQVASDARNLLIEGVWFVFTAHSPLDIHEAAILAHFVHGRPESVRRMLLDRLHDNEAGWLERIEQTPAQAREPFIRALETAAALDAAAMDTQIVEAERDLLESVGRRLGIERSADALDSLADRFHDSGLAAATSQAASHR